MDDPVPIPPLLEERPGKSGRTATGSPIHLFDPVSQSTPSFPEFEGVRLYHDLFTESEAARLIDTIDAIPFIPAQSGKGKQHYGPRINFNKRKMKAEAFHGIPAYARDIESRMRTRIREDRSLTPREHRAIDSALTTFETTDVFVLRYRPEQSSNLDFHLDDPFAYGELIADLSLQSDAVLTFLRDRPNSEAESSPSLAEEPVCVRVPLPARSLAILFGKARFEWEHAILAYDVESIRTSVSLRTLSQSFRATEDGRIVVERAHQDVG